MAESLAQDRNLIDHVVISIDGAGFHRADVAQAGSLLYRRLAIGRREDSQRSAGCQPAIRQIANLRYTRTALHSGSKQRFKLAASF